MAILVNDKERQETEILYQVACWKRRQQEELEEERKFRFLITDTEQLLSLWEGGNSLQEIAQRFGVSTTEVSDRLKEYRQY